MIPMARHVKKTQETEIRSRYAWTMGPTLATGLRSNAADLAAETQLGDATHLLVPRWEMAGGGWRWGGVFGRYPPVN